MGRIDTVFKQLKSSGKKGLIPFITAGDPDPSLTVPIMHALVESGADIIELGIPFSDPMADGPVIQRSSERALANGMNLAQCLHMVKTFRETNQETPVVLMGYANPIEHMGIELFTERAKAAGVDGVLVVDYPPEECEEFSAKLHSAGLSPIFLLAPTSSPERIQHVAKASSGYIYYVSLKGVTGSSNIDTAEVHTITQQIRAQTKTPLAIGFGIRDAQSAKKLSKSADAVIIGSKLVQILEESTPQTRLQSLKNFILEIRTALDESSNTTS
jgi:tryptophan synthase alpha chain